MGSKICIFKQDPQSILLLSINKMNISYTYWNKQLNNKKTFVFHNFKVKKV